MAGHDARMAGRGGARRGIRGRRHGERAHRAAALLLLTSTALIFLAACGQPSSGEGQGALAPTPAAPPIRAPTAPPGHVDPVVSDYIAHMTLDEKLGQLFIVNYGYPDANRDDAREMFGRMGAGGVILFKGTNIVTIPQTQRLTRDLQALARIPLVITADHEGGGNDQLDHIFGPHMSAYAIGLTNDPAVAAREAARIADELKTLGLNADFAPVADVAAPFRRWLRAFGHSPEMVSQMVIAQVDAMQSRGVMACPKHFPGLGGATVNAHFDLPVIDFSREHLERYDFAPYRALMSHQPAMIMTTDLLMPALDPRVPAELSYPIVAGVLRDEIGYEGVIVTDALYMEGITRSYSLEEAFVLSILAGNDMVEGVFDAAGMRRMVNAMKAVVRSGRLTVARIDESVRRILLMKARFGLLPLDPSRGQRDVALAPQEHGVPAGSDRATLPDRALASRGRRFAGGQT